MPDSRDAFYMPALHQKKVAETVNLMTPGAGTPWEDRGAIGPFKAFWRTANLSMRSPGKLLWQIRRPETTGDANGFVGVCGFMWGLSWAIHGLLLWLFYYTNTAYFPPRIQNHYQPAMYVLGVVLVMAASPAIAWMMLQLIAGIFTKLVSTELRGRAPEALIRNTFAYNMGPSILAVIPLAGPVVAWIWIFVAMVAGARARLRVMLSSVIIALLIASASIAVMGVLAYFVLGFIFIRVTGGGGVPMP